MESKISCNLKGERCSFEVPYILLVCERVLLGFTSQEVSAFFFTHLHFALLSIQDGGLSDVLRGYI